MVQDLNVWGPECPSWDLNVWDPNVPDLKVLAPSEYRTSKSSLFRCFRYSDPQCIYSLHNISTQSDVTAECLSWDVRPEKLSFIQWGSKI